jgi:ketosteroid isomerase-like protein
MKITTLAITLFVAAATPFAWAQEETATPAPDASPEMTVSEKTESADPSVSISTEKNASPKPKPASTPAATKDSSPAPAKSKPSATPAPAPTPSSSSAVMPAKKSTPEATIRDIEDKWEASIMRHDPLVAQAYLADDFRGISSQGKVMTKAKLVAEIRKDTDTYSSTKNGKVDVRVFGGQFAVATGVSTEVGKSKDGKDFKRSFRWTDAWMLRNGQWQCVASQAMLVK